MDICARRTIEIDFCVRPIRVNGRGRLNDLDVEPRAERRDAVDNQRARDDGCRRQEISELDQAEGGQDGEDVSVVAEVEVERLVQREGGCHVIQRHIDLGCRHADQMVLQTCEYPLNIAGSDGAAGRRLEAVETHTLACQLVRESPHQVGTSKCSEIPCCP